MIPQRSKTRVLLSEVPEDLNVSLLLTIGEEENKWLDKSFGDKDNEDEDTAETPWEADEVNHVLLGLSFALNIASLEGKLLARQKLGKAFASCGATMAHNSNHLFKQCEIIQNEQLEEDNF